MTRKQCEESTNKITASNFFFLLLLISNRKIYAWTDTKVETIENSTIAKAETGKVKPEVDR
jgi:hypothetical protein